MTEEELIAAYIEALKRERTKGDLTKLILEDLYPHQQAIVTSKARKICALTPRQVGKTFTLPRALLYKALTVTSNIPGEPIAGYLTDTFAHAEGLVWHPLLGLLEDLGIRYKTYMNKLKIILHDGSIIQLFGADDPRTAKRLRGYKFSCMIIDETQSISNEILKVMLEEDVDAALQAYSAPLILIGTPGPIPDGYFYEATTFPEKGGWEKHRWTQYDNPRYPLWRGDPNWKARVDEFLKAKAMEFGGADRPAFRREYLGEWARDEDKFCYHLGNHNLLLDAPDHRKLKTIIGVDIGYNDECAFVVVGYDDKHVYELYEYSKSGMLIHEISHELKGLIEKYRPLRVRMDSAGGGSKTLQMSLSQEMRSRFSVPVVPAEKQKKAVYMTMLDSDLARGNVLVQKKKLWSQLVHLAKDTRRGIEIDGQPCDLADAFLYAYRDCLHYYKAPDVDDGSEIDIEDNPLIARNSTYDPSMEDPDGY